MGQCTELADLTVFRSLKAATQSRFRETWGLVLLESLSQAQSSFVASRMIKPGATVLVALRGPPKDAAVSGAGHSGPPPLCFSDKGQLARPGPAAPRRRAPRRARPRLPTSTSEPRRLLLGGKQRGAPLLASPSCCSVSSAPPPRPPACTHAAPPAARRSSADHELSCVVRRESLQKEVPRGWRTALTCTRQEHFDAGGSGSPRPCHFIRCDASAGERSQHAAPPLRPELDPAGADGDVSQRGGSGPFRHLALLQSRGS